MCKDGIPMNDNALERTVWKEWLPRTQGRTNVCKLIKDDVVKERLILNIDTCVKQNSVIESDLNPTTSQLLLLSLYDSRLSIIMQPLYIYMYIYI